MAGAEEAGMGARERGDNADGKIKSRYRKYRRYIVESRQEISGCLKYLLFLVNFLFWICGIACTILGIYLYAKDFRAVFEAIDFFLNPSILLIVCGCIIFIIAFLGCTGALRENVCMLKLFSLSLFFAYICLVILAFVVFMLFYSDTKTGLSITSLLQSGVSKYNENDNMRELMDYLQSTLGCCGATSQGYKDWHNNQLYNCSPSNPTPEQCGVPPSCCKTASLPVTVTVGPRGQANPVVVPASDGDLPSGPSQPVVPNPRCGFHAQDKSITDLQNSVYTDGCLQPLQRVFESNAVIIGAVIGAVIVPVCLSVTFSNVLAKQIERQRYLLEKEARKEERRRRRNRSKFRDPFAAVTSPSSKNLARPSNPDVTSLQEFSPNPVPAPLPVKDSTKLIIDDEQEAGPSRPGPSGVRKITDVRKHVKLRKDKVPAIRKRSGNPELPPIPRENPEYRLENKKRRKDTDHGINRPGPGPDPGRDRRPGQKPPSRPHDQRLDDRGRRRNPRPDHDRTKWRSKPKDVVIGPYDGPYNGPIIVEIASTTHDVPMPAVGEVVAPVIETVETVDESATAALLDEPVQATGIVEIKEDPKEECVSRKNSQEQAKDRVNVVDE